MYKAEAPDVTSDINVIPLADVMLVMLIIFMVITPMLSKGVSVDLVMTNNPIAMQEADKEGAVLVSITRDGRVFLGSTPAPPEELTQQVQDLLSTQLDRTVYLKADARAMYRRVVEVVDYIRAAGVDNVGLITERIKAERTAPMAP